MSKYSVPANVQEQAMNMLDEQLSSLLNNSSSGSDFQRKTETKNANERIEREADGVSLSDDEDEQAYKDKVIEYANAFYQFANATNPEDEAKFDSIISALEKEFPELKESAEVDAALNTMMSSSPNGEQTAFKTATRNIEENKKQADTTYYKTSEDKAPVTPQLVKDLFGDSYTDLDDISKALNNFADKVILESQPQEFKDKCKKDVEKEWVDTDKFAYRKQTYESNGKTYEYTQAAQKVDWAKAISNTSTSQVGNFEYLRTFVSRQIYDYFGGFNRINSIVVRGNQLIINNVCYMPMLDPKTLQDASLFPLDSLEYIKNGYIAPLFNWKYLKKMHNLTLLDIDDTNFYLTDVASDIGAGRRAGLSTIFSCVPSLETFILGGEAVGAEDLNNETGRVVKEKIATHKHFINFADGYKFSIYNSTNSFQSWTTNNLKNYANNRGDKGILRFSFGLFGRGIVAGAGSILNLGAHIIGGIGQVLKQSMTPVDPDNLN